jgi:hypothetical protein
MVVFGMIDDDVAGGSSFIILYTGWCICFWNEKEPLRRASAARPHTLRWKKRF